MSLLYSRATAPYRVRSLATHNYSAGQSATLNETAREFLVNAKNAFSAAPYRSPDSLQTLVASVQDKSQSLVSQAKQTSSAGHAAAGSLKGALDQIAFVAKYFTIK